MRKWFNVLQEAVMSFAGDNAPRLGAALAYYTVFSIAPLILITITLAGVIFGERRRAGRCSSTCAGSSGIRAPKW